MTQTVSLSIVYLGPNDAAIAKNFACLGQKAGRRPLPLETGSAMTEKVQALPLSFVVGGQRVTLWIYGIPAGLRHAAVRTALIDQSDGVVFVSLPEGEATDETQKHYDQLIADLQRGEARGAVPTVVQFPGEAAPGAVSFRRLPQHLVQSLGGGDAGIADTLAAVTERSLSTVPESRLGGVAPAAVQEALARLLGMPVSH